MSISELIPDQELVDKLHNNDIDAFDQIFKRYSDRLYGFTFKYLKSKEETEGVIQDVFLKIWENRNKIKKETSLKSYLFTITYHKMCRIFRSRQLKLKYVETINGKQSTVVDSEEQIEYSTVLEMVDNFIGKLPQKQKTIFIKSRKEGKSTREIAEEMNLSAGTINNNISLALKFLRTHFSKEGIFLILFSLLLIFP